MLKVKLIAVGKLKEQWLRDGLAEYQKRLRAYCAFECVELEESRLAERPSEAQIASALEKEGEAILRRCGSAPVVPLCIEGEMLSSEQLADWLDGCRQTSGEVCFVIGSSFGLSEKVKRAGALRLSMSRMTFPHQLARVMLAEQLYRAFSISAGGKYHK